MSVLSHRLDTMRVRAASGGVSAELHGRTRVEVSFAAGFYRHSDERLLEQHLSSVGRLLWAARMKEYYAAVSEAFGETFSAEPPAAGWRDEELLRLRSEIVAEGRSTDGRIHVAVQGMQRWSVRIAPGTVRALDEPGFARGAGEAAHELIVDQQAEIRALKDRVYG